MLGAGERNAPKLLRRNCGQRQADRRSGLGRVEEKFSALRYAIATQRHEGIQRDLEAGARLLALLGDARLKG